MGAIGYCFRHRDEFKGRATRSQFWYFMLFYVVVVTILMTLSALIAGALGGAYDEFNQIVFLGTLLSIPFMIPKLSVSVRRLHDCGCSGTLAVVQFIATMVGAFCGGAGIILMANVARIISAELGIILLLLCASSGTKGPNKYGPDPRQKEIYSR